MAASRDLANLGDTITGVSNVNIDSGTLFVDAVNGLLGVGTTSPIRKLSVDGGEISVYGQSSGNAAFINISNTSGSAGNTFTLHLRGLANNGAAAAQLAGIVLNAANTYVYGTIKSSVQSQTADVSNASQITIATTTPTTIASVSITTTGKKVLLIATGDMNPQTGNDWNWLALYRDSSQIGKLIIAQGGGTSFNNPFALSHIDTPAAGTYTYTLKAYQGSGTNLYGETGNGQAPTIIAVELL